MRILSKHFYGYILVLTLLISVSSCSNFSDSEYNRIVKKELAKGIRSDSLFMGIYLGMHSKAFYGHCWEMNKKGLVTNGSNNTTVLYKVTKELKYISSMNFYPDFQDDKIFRMKVSFDYDGWAPWNKPHSADSLLPDVLHMLKNWYPNSNDFIKMTDKDRGTIYVKVDGNRRITAGIFDERTVKVDYTDLLIEEKQKK